MKKFFPLTLLFFLFFTGNAQTAKEYSEMAGKKYEQKDYKYALALIDKAITLEPKDQWLYLQKADIQFELTGPGDALRIVEKAISINRRQSEPYNRAGVYYDSRGRSDSAIQMYDLAIKYAENDTAKYSYIANRGTARASVRDFKGAVADYEEVLKFDPHNMAALNNASACYDDLGMMDRSVSMLKKVIALDPTFIGPYVNLGFLYSKSDSLDKALDYFTQAATIDPNDPLVLNNRGYVYYKKADYTNALKDINASIKIYPTNSYAFRNLALVYIAQKKMDEACAALGFARDYGFEQRYGPEVGELMKTNCKK